MVFQWFKNKSKSTSSNHHVQRRVLIPAKLQTGDLLDFIYKVESQAILFEFDLSLILQSSEDIEKITYETGDTSLELKDFTYKKNQFSVIIEGGWDNCKSTILFNVETKTNQFYKFTVLVTIISHLKNKVDQDNGQRVCRLWVLDRNPDANYIQENQEPWIEGDMIVNLKNRYLWELRLVDEQKTWLPLFVLNGITQPVITYYSDAQDSGERLKLNHIYSDQGKIKSNSKGNVSIQGELNIDSIYTKAIIAAHPLGEGMLFTSPGMMAGHSLYIGSPEAKPKNIYIGMPGVVSTKLVSTDYLQMAPLTIKEIPSQVTKGTLILCVDYKGFSDLVMLYAKKDNPQSLDDWKPLFITGNTQEKEIMPPRPTPTSKPHLYPVSFNPNIHPSKLDTSKIVEMRSVQDSSKDIPVKSQEKEPIGSQTYTRIQLEREFVPVSVGPKANWKKVIINDIQQQLYGEGGEYWYQNDHFWEVPTKGLLHVQGWFIFSEEQLNSSEPISYHAGDVFLLNIACNQEKKIELYPITQLEFPLVPYVNDVTHKVCANQQLPFSMTYPVEKSDKITFSVAYVCQNSAYSKAKELPIKKAVITLFVS